MGGAVRSSSIRKPIFPNSGFGVEAASTSTLAKRCASFGSCTARFQSGRPVVALEGFTTISEAERLAGCELRIPESEQQPLPADVYYERSLVGCEVRTVDDVSVGKVIAVRGVPGANRLLVQSRDPQDEAEIEIPLVDSICVSVDLEQNVVVVDPPVGLLELNRRGV